MRLLVRALARLIGLLIGTTTILIVATRIIAPALPSAGQFLFSGTLNDLPALYLFDLSHRQMHPLARGAVYPAVPSWSGDSRQLAYVAAPLGSADTQSVMTYDSRHYATTALYPDATTTGSVLQAPLWSPDAQQVVFSFAAAGQLDSGDVALVRVRTTNADVATLPLPDAEAHNHTLTWQSNSPLRYIVVTGDQVRLQEIDLDDLSIDTLQTWNLSFYRTWEPVVAPDGDRFLVPAMQPPILTYDLYLFDVTSGAVSNITARDSGNETQPVWSADGTTIAYKLLSDVGQFLMISRPDGSDARVLYRHARSRISDIRFAPDDRHISFQLEYNGDEQVCLITIADGALDCPISAAQLANTVWRP